MLLYGSTDSGHSYKVKSFLLLSRTPHDYRWIALDTPRSERPAEFIAASKFGEVPILVDEGAAFCQSNAILVHLAQRTGAFRGNQSEWGAVLEWLFWETNRIGFSVPNLRFSLRWVPQPPEVLVYLRARAIADLQTLNEVLTSSEFLLPSGPTIADLSCSAYLFWLSQTGIPEEDFPSVSRWLRSLRALSGWIHPDQALKPS
jgi:glutathione S-transferase